MINEKKDDYNLRNVIYLKIIPGHLEQKCVEDSEEYNSEAALVKDLCR